MQIEIASPGQMGISGSAIIDSIQDKHTPILDLLVRESIQNSLDAAIQGEKNVKVDFHIGRFSPKRVNDLLEGVSGKLNKRYTNEMYDYIAISDTNTLGLTGPVNIREVDDERNYGNLIKLVYDISKPQTQESAGGSWGLGKTTYYRIGIGLVFYYSRIKNDSGKYESRLAIALIEDERLDEALIPPAEGFKVRRGIAWWGEPYGNGAVIPLINEVEIEKILSFFDIQPFQGEDTGTKIIIPYIDKQKLLDNNRPYIDDENDHAEKINAPWYNSVEEYLRIAVQRWYILRLNNSVYNAIFKKAILNVSINGQFIQENDIDPIFALYQKLYNAGICGDSTNDEIKIEEIKIREALKNTSIAGKIVYKNVSLDELGMLPPNNLPSPETYCKLEILKKDSHKPIFAFTRKLGMIVSYKNTGNWLEGVPSIEDGLYLISIFVPNSDNILQQCEGISLDEYLRRSEQANHTSWIDHSDQRIVKKIKDGVRKQLAKALKKDDEKTQPTKGTPFSRTLGDLILPKLGFGRKPSGGSSNGNSGNSKSSGGAVFSIDPSKTRFFPSYMEVEASWSSASSLTEASLTLAIDSGSGPINASEWETILGLDMPFEIEEASLTFSKLDGQKNNEQLSAKKNESGKSNHLCSLRIENTSKGAGNAIILRFAKDMKFKSTIRIIIRFSDSKRDKKPVFRPGKER